MNIDDKEDYSLTAIIDNHLMWQREQAGRPRVQGSLGTSADQDSTGVETEVFRGILVLCSVTDEQIPDLTADKQGAVTTWQG
ncbi:unnamed protein product [Boreogadus saida]